MIIAAFFVVSSIVTSIFYLSLRERIKFIGAENIQIINMELTVRDVVGLNADTEMLNFGIIMPGSGVTRRINITNTNPYNVSVRLFKEGNISEFVNFQQEHIVESNTSKSIDITAGIPFDTPSESYSGKLKVAFFPILD